MQYVMEWASSRVHCKSPTKGPLFSHCNFISWQSNSFGRNRIISLLCRLDAVLNSAMTCVESLIPLNKGLTRVGANWSSQIRRLEYHFRAWIQIAPDNKRM